MPRRLIADRLHIDEPAPGSRSHRQRCLDSLALVEFLFELESTFGIELALEELDIENFRHPDADRGRRLSAANPPDSAAAQK